jgi:hypothetical protein
VKIAQRRQHVTNPIDSEWGPGRRRRAPGDRWRARFSRAAAAPFARRCSEVVLGRERRWADIVPFAPDDPRDRPDQPNLLLVEREWVLAAWPVERVEEVEGVYDWWQHGSATGQRRP